ncbi:hypothetical protein L3X38_041880 [Prunus dulcis]|uniref:Uncharacterized protein n=1 Tax=Prunus dulcis TaxID=3755 RepID=A0AAD4UVJ6_PRUDU|nr:hypothetical protein L3X38_041880 [Prunus dulcis]
MTVTVTSSESLTHIGNDNLSTSIFHSLSPLSTSMPRDGVLVSRFLENLKMEDCLVSSGSILLGRKLLTFNLNSVLRGDVVEFC